MTVYIDTSSNNLRGTSYCHMTADTMEELHAMARQLNLGMPSFQNKPRHKHYDVTARKRLKAIALGAVLLSPREYAIKVQNLRRSY